MDDLIRRSDAIEALDMLMANDDEWYRNAFKKELMKIPSIEPKQERCEYCKDGDFMGQRQMLGNDGKWHKIRFCPNCGALMREREGK